MTDNNNYWPFAQGMVNTTQPNIIMSQEQQQQQKQQQQQPPHQQQQQQPLPPVAATHQQQWAPSATTSSESDKRKWGQAYNDYDMNSHANKMFQMDDYSNNEPSEADSPDSNGGSGGGGSHMRNDLLSDSSMFQGGDQKQRRKEQNRAAQRAFRERKERYVKELQIKIKEMEKKHDSELSRITKENESLKDLVKNMEAEIYTLKGAAMAFDVTISKLRKAGLDVTQPSHVVQQQRKQHQQHPTSFSPTQLNHQQSPVPTNTYIPASSSSASSSTAMATIRDKDGYPINQGRSIHNPLYDSFRHVRQKSKSSNSHRLVYNGHNHDDIDDDDDDDEDDDHIMKTDSFAERETSRFQHQVDTIMNSGVKLIPCSQIWERLSQHPNFEDFDMDRLCEELKKKAKCSGTGPVIPESDIQEVLHKMDIGIAE